MALLGIAVAAVGCTDSHWSVLPYPIPMALSGVGGGLVASATVDGTTAPFPVAVDTGTILTTYDDGSGRTFGRTGDLSLFGIDSAGRPIPRLSITQIPLFEGPIGSLGVGANAVPLGGVIGGDNLKRFALSLDYRGAAPAMTLVSNVTPCSCELAPACDRKQTCNAVLPFSLAGGQDTTLQSQTRIVIGNNLYSYPSTRVLFGACLEPYLDPVETVVCAGSGPTDCPDNPAYLPSGVDVQLLVATGFPGVALSASAYDRLRGIGAAAELFAGPQTQLHLVDPADEGPDGAGVMAAVTTVGRPMTASDPGASAVALVSMEKFFGPCASLARSRRVRRYYLTGTTEQCRNDTDRKCAMYGGTTDPYTATCQDQGGDNCSDTDRNTPIAAVVEMKRPLAVYVLPDVTPLLVGINADVRSTQPSVDGIIGTELLARLTTTIDYPGGRLIARCAAGSDECLAYPRLSLPSVFDCGFCEGTQPIRMAACPDGPGFHACPPAP